VGRGGVRFEAESKASAAGGTVPTQLMVVTRSEAGAPANWPWRLHTMWLTFRLSAPWWAVRWVWES